MNRRSFVACMFSAPFASRAALLATPQKVAIPLSWDVVPPLGNPWAACRVSLRWMSPPRITDGDGITINEVVLVQSDVAKDCKWSYEIAEARARMAARAKEGK